MKVLIAGGAGYIGTHTAVALLEAGYEVIIVDSLINSHSENIQRVEKIASKTLQFVEADIRNARLLDQVFSDNHIDAVINFAGHKAVGDSVRQPLHYYDNNLNCAIGLLECMSVHNVRQMVFSSSATVYGEPCELPLTENARIAPCNPYGRTKQYIEEMLRDVSRADVSWKFSILRYFNPVGAHPSGLLGERPGAVPENLMPNIIEVAIGNQQRLEVFGDDYDTRDGTAVRDYIHVMDLARGHVKAIQSLQSRDQNEALAINLGTGKGYSVLEILQAFEVVSGRKIAYEVVGRRAGDVACCYSDPALAREVLDWEAKLGIEEMCRDAWNWQQQLAASIKGGSK